jgi:diguanylate cyclase (GGDEF)-like protein
MMNAKKIIKSKKHTLKKSFSMRFRFLATVIFAMLAITIFIGGICIYEVDNYIQTQAEDFVKVTCDKEATKINDSLSNMEKSVKIMESYLMDFFTSKADIKNPTLQKKVIEKADQMFTDVAKHTSTKGAIAYYFRFDPSISTGTSGLFHTKLSGSDTFHVVEPTDITIYEKDDTEHVGWFWQPYEAKKPIWMKPYYNKNNNIWMISYIIPMYFEDLFIGIVGMDFDYVVLSKQVHQIKLYENGFAHLEMDGEIICDDVHKTELQNTINSKKYMRTSKELANGMTLALSASYDDIRQICEKISFKILFAVLILSVLFTVIAVIVTQKIVDPLKKLTDASIKLSKGDYNVEIANSNTYEINMLSAAFETMTTRLHEREELLHLSANRDSLTGLRNTTSYASWVEKIDAEINGENTKFGVMVLDLNDLKETNDRYGHAVGNKLIVTTANAISSTFKDSLVFRIGGDEFLVVLQNGDLENYEKTFAQFDLTCANTFVEEGDVKLPIRIAKGFAIFDSGKDLRFADVFKRADAAMYENKNKTKTAQIL